MNNSDDKIQSEYFSSDQVTNNKDKTRLDDIYHKLDNEQDKLIQRWLDWSQSKVIGEYTLSVVYCIVALVFMLLFAFNSYLEEYYLHAKVLLIFSVLTGCNLFFLVIKHNERMSNTFVVVLFGGLCIYLFVTGGVNQTGPLWYFVYPLTALFILNLWEGLFMTVLLFWATMVIYSIQTVHLDYNPYSGSFIARFFSVYIAIAILSFLYAYSRSKNDLVHRKE